jgi:hypothetical protein
LTLGQPALDAEKLVAGHLSLPASEAQASNRKARAWGITPKRGLVCSAAVSVRHHAHDTDTAPRKNPVPRDRHSKCMFLADTFQANSCINIIARVST